ncbi:MAG: calcium-translocating P-type ATPase, PMCA-type [Lachnospiraceae bacterium]|jgi:Ca2+-transporting ATPase
MRFYCEEKEQVLQHLNATMAGLTSEEAAARQETYGKNCLEAGKKKSIIRRFLEQLADPMIIILLAAAAVSAVLAIVKNESFVDVIIILAVVLINAVLGVYQESKAEKAIEALQEMSAATSKVLRDGKIITIHSEDLVPGDIIFLEAGDAVPADGRILEVASMKVEEAALTGESVPVTKKTDALSIIEGEKDVLLGDRRNMAYMGSAVVYGRGTMVVTDIGMSTEMGKIAGALAQAVEGKTPLQIKLTQLSKVLTVLVLAICAVVFAVQLIRSDGLNFELVIDSLMIAVSLAVAAIPEGLVAVVTVVLSIGVTNMSKKNAIIRKLTAVETLGCAQIICSDKTGTLTQNKMTVVDFFCEDEKYMSAGMALCTDAEMNSDGSVVGEPTEAALVEWANKLGQDKPTLKAKFIRCGEAPFDSMRKMMSTVHTADEGYIQFTKGAPDEVVKLCTHYIKDGVPVPMTDEFRNEIFRRNEQMADRALRVLACAQRTWESEPSSYEWQFLEQDLCFVGLEGMIDPVRPEVHDAIVKCREAGITPIMITGDHIGTAIAIARELGILDGGKKAITGAQLSAMDDEEFAAELENISVYARVQPEHKTRIVNAWQAKGCITAMTGDGVNDAPSIKVADIGVGMGITGTDVTKNVADMVLADDNFATIVSAVEEGRRIYDNICKSIQFLLASNMSEVIAVFVASLLGFTILKPVHLLWINLITDCFPALALGLEEAEPDVMNKKPRDSRKGLFAGGMGVDIVYQGLIVSVLVLAAYFIGAYIEKGVWAITESTHGMTMAFLSLSFVELFHSFNMRSQRKSIFRLHSFNKALLLSAIVALTITVLVCQIPLLANAFGFARIGFIEYVIAIALAAWIIPIVEMVKLIQRRIGKHKN